MKSTVIRIRPQKSSSMSSNRSCTPVSPWGDILGNAERLRQYTTADALRFTHRYYHPQNAVFYVYGDVPFAQIVRTLERLLPPTDFAAFTAPALSSIPPQPQITAQERIVSKGTHQAHVLIGAPTFAGTDARRFALLLLNNMLGGPGMNSRLSLSLRERPALFIASTPTSTPIPTPVSGTCTSAVMPTTSVAAAACCCANCAVSSNVRSATHSLLLPKSNSAVRWLSQPKLPKAMPWPSAKPLPTTAPIATSARFAVASAKSLLPMCSKWPLRFMPTTA